MRVGSLFSGIGGLDLGLERAGMTVVWQSEIDPYATKVLAKHWPTVPNLGDITRIDWATVEPVDLICGGYPCQPFSLAGSRRGEADPRHLWPHFARAICLLRPRYVLAENVPGHLGLGFDRVLADLAGLGYDAEWDCIPAAAVGAPHLRYRLFIIATDTGSARRRQNSRSTPGDESPHARRATQNDHLASSDGTVGDVADTDGGRLEKRREPHGRTPTRLEPPRRNHAGRRGTDVADTDAGRRNGRPRQLGPRRRREPAYSGWWASEPDVGRVAHGIPHRVDRLRCLGNAVVPQVAEHIGHLIMNAAVA